LLPFSLSAQKSHSSSSFSFTTIDFSLVGGPTGNFNSLSAINDRGQIVGGFFTSVSQSSGQYLFDRGEFTQISADVIGTGGAVTGINNRDEISGQVRLPGAFHVPGFLFDLHRGTETVLDVPGTNWTEPGGLNDKGEVVGRYMDANTDTFHGFLWRSGTFNVIDFPGATFMIPRAINNRGQIVGSYSMNNDLGDTHAFFMSSDNSLP
jgi:uncharacterized membrane protein